ncbi:MAG TPA: stage II sporulation protein M [Gallionellaceae bacterium]|nr:stage II sporulation protein M [Gallionellaceae bacterium]
MKELQFVARRELAWAAWERWLRTTTATGKRRKTRPAKAADSALTETEAQADRDLRENLPHAFRALSHDLALARDRQYSSLLQDRLRVLVLAAHQRIYGARKKEGLAIFRFVLHGFPALVRRERRVIALAAALLLIPLLAMLIALQFYPDSVYLMMSPDSVTDVENMYAPTAKRLGQAHAVSGEWKMWGLYIANNIGLDFQCFAGGLAFGVGSVFFLIYNGLFIGAIAGHLTQIGYIETFWSFVAGHSAFEMTGAVLSGAAGLKLAQALIAPGLRTRRAALVANAKIAIQLLLGAAALTFFAAFIEAFWSAERLFPAHLKYGVGIAMWCITLAYLVFAGKERHAP